jgi:hypothetical protein
MGGGRRQSSWGIGARNQNRFGRYAQNNQVVVGLSRGRPSGFLQKGFDVTASKTLDSPDRMTGQLASSDHPVDGHRRQLQQLSKLPDGIEFRRVVVSQSRSWHLFPSTSPHILINLEDILREYITFVKLLLCCPSIFYWPSARAQLSYTDFYTTALDLWIERNLLYLRYAKHHLSIIFFNLLISI